MSKIRYISICLIILINPFLRAEPPNWQVITGTQYSMVLMAEVLLDNEIFANEGDNTIAAFGPGGESDCRSIAAWQLPNPPQHNGFWYFTIVSNNNGDNINFKLYEEASDQIYDCNENLDFINDETIGNPTDLYTITANETYTQNNLICDQIELEVYPNPFNPSTTISFQLNTETSENTQLIIYNLRGQKVKTFGHPEPVEGYGKPLSYSVVWNGRDEYNNTVSSGVYFVKLKAGKEIKNKKILLLK